MASPTRSADLETLLELLDLEQTSDDVFVGHHPAQVSVRTFGGQLLAQAIMAAGRTVGRGTPIHAVNAHFIRGGDVTAPIEYHVDRHREGRSFANRMVTGYQVNAKGERDELFVMLASFLDWSPGLEHAAVVPLVPEPDDLPSIHEHLAGYEDQLKSFVEALKPIDMRYTNDPAWIMKGKDEKLGHNRVWMRADGDLPDDPLIHVAAMAYSSDTTVLDSIITTHGLSWGFDRIMAVTMNHSMWFHRPFSYDEWTLYATESPVAAGSRGLATGRFFSRDGEQLATVVQEGVIKYFPKRI